MRQCLEFLFFLFLSFLDPKKELSGSGNKGILILTYK